MPPLQLCQQSGYGTGRSRFDLPAAATPAKKTNKQAFPETLTCKGSGAKRAVAGEKERRAEKTPERRLFSFVSLPLHSFHPSQSLSFSQLTGVPLQRCYCSFRGSTGLYWNTWIKGGVHCVSGAAICSRWPFSFAAVSPSHSYSISSSLSINIIKNHTKNNALRPFQKEATILRGRLGCRELYSTNSTIHYCKPSCGLRKLNSGQAAPFLSRSLLVYLISC